MAQTGYYCNVWGSLLGIETFFAYSLVERSLYCNVWGSLLGIETSDSDSPNDKHDEIAMFGDPF